MRFMFNVRVDSQVAADQLGQAEAVAPEGVEETPDPSILADDSMVDETPPPILEPETSPEPTPLRLTNSPRRSKRQLNYENEGAKLEVS